jgi:hypothetical protein
MFSGTEHIARRFILWKIEMNWKTLLRNLRDLRFSRRWWWRVEFSGMLMPDHSVGSDFEGVTLIRNADYLFTSRHGVTFQKAWVFVAKLIEGSIKFLLSLSCCSLPIEKCCQKLAETSLWPRLSHSAAFVDRKEFWVLISYIYIYT